MKDPGEHAPQVVAYDACAWLGNVATSVLIVFVNKVLMDPKKGFRFQFGESRLFE
jgi:solute carrier family 35 protein E3